MKKFLLLLALVSAGPAMAQRSSPYASRIRPYATLSGVPCSPALGEVAFKYTVPTGFYFCSANDTWSLLASSSGVVSGSGTTNFVPLWSSGSALGNSLFVQGTNLMEQKSGSSPQTFRVFETTANTGSAFQVNTNATVNVAIRAGSKQFTVSAPQRPFDFGFEDYAGGFLGWRVDLSGHLQAIQSNQEIGSVTAPYRLTLGGAGAGTTGVLRLTGFGNNGSVSHTVPDSVTSYTLTWPAAQGAASTFVKNDGSGILSFSKAVLSTDVSGTLPVANGGTGVASTTAYALLAGGTTSTGAFQSLAGVGTSGQMLVSNGASALPAFSNTIISPIIRGLTVVTLTDAATIATNAALGNHFRVTLTADRTLGNPTNATDGQKVVWEVIQDGTGSHTLAFDTQFAFGTDIATCTLSTAASKRDFIGAIYNSTATKWYVTSCVRGYNMIPDWLFIWAAASWLMRRKKR